MKDDLELKEVRVGIEEIMEKQNAVPGRQGWRDCGDLGDGGR
jgi:hypothetical protein